MLSEKPMSPTSPEDPRALLRALPAVDTLLQMPAVVEAAGGLARPFVVDAVREALDEVRTRLLSGTNPILSGTNPILSGTNPLRSGTNPILSGTNLLLSGTNPLLSGTNPLLSGTNPLLSGTHPIPGGGTASELADELAAAAAERIFAMKRRFLTRVINATGVVLHTNLGRAPLSAASLQAVADVSAGYSNLEYTVDGGKRGSRHDYGEAMLTRLTGAEAAMVVNNNAAAVLLVLSALAHGREVILSRGEMIEIGGAFRIPEVMEQSGCVLREIGTTNRTHLRDYERAVGEETAAILKVHPSNYKISGFTASVSARELAALARRHDIPLIEDLGSGVLIATDKYGLAREPTVQASVEAGADIVTFSGDKLLGGPQAGIIVGRRDLIARCKAHPLARALRVDKMTLAALQATLTAYLDGDVEKIPIYAMLGASVDELRERGRAIVAEVRRAAAGSPFYVDVIDTISTVGGGSLPGETQPSAGIAVRVAADPAPHTATGRSTPTVGTMTPGTRLTPDRLASVLRRDLPPIVARIEGDTLILDLRTVDRADDSTIAARLADALRSVTNATPSAVGDAAEGAAASCT